MRIGSGIGLIVVVGAIASCAACSSSTSGSTGGSSGASPAGAGITPSTGSTPPTSSTGNTGSTPPTSSQLLARLLKAADLPTGWKGTAHQTSADDEAEDKAVVECIGGPGTDPKAGQVAEVYSMDFSMGNANIGSSADSYKTAEDVKTQISLITSSKTSGCYEKVLRTDFTKTLATGDSLTSLSFTVTPGSGGGPSDVVATASGKIGVKAKGQTGTVYLSVAFIAHALTTAEVTTENVDAPVDASLVSSLVTKVADRIGA